jgi:hypothetical protein
MATVNGPLLSISAHGAIKNTILFRRINGRNVVSLQPTEPKIPLHFRGVQPALMRLARIHWRTLTNEEQQTWRNLEAQNPCMSGYNIFIRWWFSQHHYNSIPIFNCVVFGRAFYSSAAS